ncbi:MAG: enolase C-terminal domain-like protein [Planctomycetota bacterium]|nr:enolase C-terminal domain-like protein [Planctomycetota bacterium]
MTTIHKFDAQDRRFELEEGAGSDAVHTDPQYGYAVTRLHADSGLSGTGLAYTLGAGNELICEAIRLLVRPLLGREIEELMAEFGSVQRSLAEHQALRWLGPHKGVIHSALASITIACFDLWAKHRQVPLWRLLLDLESRELANLIDFSYLEDVLTRDQAIAILDEQRGSRASRQQVLEQGYPGYDTSVGWFQYSDERIRENALRAVERGFTAMKLKVGSPYPEHDIRRLRMIREAVGENVKLMIDANQAWSVPTAIETCRRMSDLNLNWVEEPTQPDDVLGHAEIAKQIAPVPVAVGECVANRILWKNFLEAQAVGVVQADCTRLAGISEYLAVAILATRYPVQVIPHVGDMGQIHQQLVLFNHIALGHKKLFLEHIPHLRKYFVHPAEIRDGRYVTSEIPGCGTDLKD